MTGGLIQLVAKGIPDIYLTGNPNITYFKILYRRHTEFSMVDYPIKMTNYQQFDAEYTIEIPHVADLLDRMTLVVDIEKPNIKKREATVMNIKNLFHKYDIEFPDNFQYDDNELITIDKLFGENPHVGDNITKKILELN